MFVSSLAFLPVVHLCSCRGQAFAVNEIGRSEWSEWSEELETHPFASGCFMDVSGGDGRFLEGWFGPVWMLEGSMMQKFTWEAMEAERGWLNILAHGNITSSSFFLGLHYGGSMSPPGWRVVIFEWLDPKANASRKCFDGPVAGVKWYTVSTYFLLQIL